MIPLDMPVEKVGPTSVEEWSELQLSVARRADALARGFTAGRSVDRRLWLRAEWEVFERWEKAGFRCWE